MGGGSISRVVASKAASVPVGAMVSSNGWERFTVQKAKGVQTFEEGTDGLDPVHHIGVLGNFAKIAEFSRNCGFTWDLLERLSNARSNRRQRPHCVLWAAGYWGTQGGRNRAGVRCATQLFATLY